jgi:hypothetical protein
MKRWLANGYEDNINRWHFSAHANETTELIVFDAKFLRDISEMHHDFGYELMKRISSVLLERLQETRLLLVDFLRLTLWAALRKRYFHASSRARLPFHQVSGSFNKWSPELGKR